MWANRRYIILGVLVFLFALLVQTPLQFIWPTVKPYTRNLPVSFSQVQGTIWSGQTTIQTPMAEFNNIKASWHISAWSLLKLQLDLDLKLQGQGLLVTGNAQLSSSKRVSVSELNGYLDTAPLQSMLGRMQVQLEGDFNLTKTSADIEINENQFLIHSLSGQLVYSGGRVGFPIDGNPIQSQLPMLLGKLSKEGKNKATLDLTTTQGLPIGKGYAQNDGWAGLAIRRRFLDILNQPWPAKADADTVIFEVSQKLF